MAFNGAYWGDVEESFKTVWISWTVNRRNYWLVRGGPSVAEGRVMKIHVVKPPDIAPLFVFPNLWQYTGRGGGKSKHCTVRNSCLQTFMGPKWGCRSVGVCNSIPCSVMPVVCLAFISSFLHFNLPSTSHYVNPPFIAIYEFLAP